MGTVLPIYNFFKLDHTWSKKLTLLLVFSFLFTGLSFAQVTENYQMQTGNFNATHTTNINASYTAGTFNNGTTELGTFANGTGGGFIGNPGVATFRTFTESGTNNTSTARPLQIGDEFTITGFVNNSSSFFGGGTAGVSFNASTNNGAFSDYETDSRIQLQINQNGNWFIDATTSTANGFSAPGNDATITFKLNTPNRATVTLTGTNGATTYDVELGNSGVIESFVIWNQTSGNSNDMFWKDASLTATGEIELGTSNNSFTVSDVLTDGLDANSSSVSITNNLVKNGTGSVTLSGVNTYTGTTTINNGSLILGAAGVIPNGSNLVLNGGTLSSGATTGFSETLGTLRLNTNSTIDLGTGSHALTFSDSSAETWTGSTVLTINGWTGTAGSSGGGTEGTINIGSSGLSSTQLNQIQFNGFPQGAVLTASGEIVPEFEALPSTNASSLVYDNIGRTRIDISWTNGDGANRIVVLKAGSAVDASPVSGTTYTANAVFGNGDEIGTGNFVVYNGNGSSVTVTGLTAGTTYHLEIFEYNGSSGGESYLTPGLTVSQATTTDYLTNASGTLNWNTAADWLDGNVPPSGASVVIRSDMTLNINPTVSSIEITSGNTFTGADASARTLTIADGGSFTNDGTFTATANNTVSFSGNNTVSGTVVFNNVTLTANGTDFGSGSTVNGNLNMNGGFVSNSNPPSYGSSSTLIYDVSGNWGRGDEWSSTSGAGYPNNVTVASGTNLDMGANGGAAISRQCAGNLTVEGTFSMDINAMSQSVTVLGNFVNNGTTTLSSTGGGDLVLQGDFDDDGTFTANGRAVFFEGGNTQNITSVTDPLEIDVMRINKSGGEVVMEQNLLVDETADPLDISSATSYLNLNGNTLTIGKTGVTSNVTMTSGSEIRGSATSGLVILGDGDLGTINLGSGATATLGNLDINREASGRVTIDSDLIVETTGNIRAGNTLEVTGNITNNGNITFESDATGTAQLDTFTGTLSGTGDVTVERYIPAERAFRLLASPVITSGSIFDNWQEGGIYPTSANNIGTHITGVQGTVGQSDAATGLDQTASGNPSMFRFDNAHIDPLSGTDQSGAWEAVTSTNQSGDNLNAEMPYLLFVRGDRSIDLSSNSSTPTNTTLSATGTLFTNSTSTQTLSDQPEYFSLVANPFQAIVDFNALTFTGLGNANFMYVYDPTQKDYETLETGTNDADMFIRPGQSVFVVNNTGSVTTSTVEIEQVDINTSPTPGPSTTVFNENQIANLELELYNDTNDLRENLRIRFEDNASNAIDSFDAPKLMGTSENLASINSGNIYTIERRASVQDTDNVPLHLDQYQGNNYEFRLNLDNWNSDIEIFIADNYLNTQTLITPNQGYSFTVDQNIPESIAENRFSLVFDNTTLGVDDNTFGANFKLYPNPSPNGQFHIKTPNLNGEVNVEISNLLGQQVSVQKLFIEEQQVNVNAENLSSGIYLVKLSQDNQSFSTKLMVE